MTDEMKKKIGERIKAARKAKGLSQEVLGEKLEVSFQAVSSWETGKFIPDAFSRKWMVRYTEETDRYYPAILDAVKKVPEWNNAWWLLRYQLTTMTEAFKRLLS
jgi:transcriptional regulator with XRE-family HTH domain